MRTSLLHVLMALGCALTGCYREVDPFDPDAGDAGAPSPNDAPHTPTACPASAPQHALLWGESGDLYAFDPEAVTSERIGHVGCPSSANPETLAVSRDGFAIVEYTDGGLFRVDLATLECIPMPGLHFDSPVSLALSSDAAAERLFVLRTDAPPELGAADLATLTLRPIAHVGPDFVPSMLELKVDATGRMFALSEFGRLFEIDSASGRVRSVRDTDFDGSSGWALLSWHDDLYFIGGTNGDVARFDPSAPGRIRHVGSVGVTIVGAGAAACVPQ